ncbi:MAG: thiol peroxidase [candidate division Zixibacteria bacterium]|jgi:thiol peroxidase|nr:thiol peroxidase [candidate division Zixibacteria bacterium]NIR64589.1 thiol peroxidase [candidate division Zixibacteria bacterium]NIS16712.1 thiol peroxidase [candidate division Zixibacteria bacterium]NIS46447.1 thiol peroxidase [candidate division Zixibacteria bacterium]NIT53101.1 thiol peroxidase [candidate division Zixibacteria bacterium]
MAEERTGVVSILGKPMTLLGPELKEGDTAPDFQLLDNDLKSVRLSDSDGSIRLLSVVSSLDTEVCALQTERFNKEVKKISDEIKFFTISMDLPFAQKRWVDENELEDVITLSDFNDADFGLKYGLLLKEIRLLSRAVVIVDKNNKIVDFQIVPEVSDEPDYARSLEALRKIV